MFLGEKGGVYAGADVYVGFVEELYKLAGTGGFAGVKGGFGLAELHEQVLLELIGGLDGGKVAGAQFAGADVAAESFDEGDCTVDIFEGVGELALGFLEDGDVVVGGGSASAISNLLK